LGEKSVGMFARDDEQQSGSGERGGEVLKATRDSKVDQKGQRKREKGAT